MELYDFVKLIRNKKNTIFTIVFTILVLVLAVNFALPKKYGSELQVLIIQNNLNNTDPYLVSKSSEHLGNILTRVVYSGSFYKKVINSGFGIGGDYFGKTSKDQLKKWSKTIVAKNIEDTGIIFISAKHPDRNQAELLVESIGYNLKTAHTEYHGSGENVVIKIINEPITSNFPVEPNLLTGIITGALFGIMFSLLYIYLFPDEKYNLSLLPKNKERKIKKIKSSVIADMGDDEFPEYIKKSEEIFEPEEIATNDQKKESEMGGYLDESEDNLNKSEKENLNTENRNDDLDIDYEDIKRKGNINNIL